MINNFNILRFCYSGRKLYESSLLLLPLLRGHDIPWSYKHDNNLLQQNLPFCYQENPHLKPNQPADCQNNLSADNVCVGMHPADIYNRYDILGRRDNSFFTYYEQNCYLVVARQQCFKSHPVRMD